VITLIMASFPSFIRGTPFLGGVSYSRMASFQRRERRRRQNVQWDLRANYTRWTTHHIHTRLGMEWSGKSHMYMQEEEGERGRVGESVSQGWRMYGGKAGIGCGWNHH
jgi:hypothetical protein